MTTAIRLSNVVKNFGEVQAVAGVNLEIADGEFFAMLGPSGSGKTTVLRLIAGFELPDSGHIEIDELARHSGHLQIYREILDAQREGNSAS